jgi:hypothetical protein
MINAASNDDAPSLASAKNAKFNELFAALEDLLKRIADTDDPDIRRKRALVRAEMIAVQSNPWTLGPAPPQAVAEPTDDALAGTDPDSAAWGQQALVALAGAAVALSVFRG